MKKPKTETGRDDTDRAATHKQLNFVRVKQRLQRTLVRHHLKASPESRKLLFDTFVEQKVGIQLNELLRCTHT